jgi:hypothetical protein
MKFPKTKNEILALAQTVNNGLKANTTIFTRPSTETSVMDTDLAAHMAKRDEITAAEALVRQLYEDDAEILERIEDGTKSNLKYVESIAKGDAGTLALVGWGVPSARTALEKPAECRALEIVGQGDGWLQIDWKEPIGGGKVASYIVERSEDGVTFVEAKTETVSESILLNQPKGKKLIYQVVGINKAGKGMASNTVNLML